MAKFVKLPVEIEAIDVRPWDADRTAEWCGGTVIRNGNAHCLGIDIPTLEGVMRADVGDYVIKGVKGEFYPCKPDIFAATYRPADA